ncbi:MAG: hypothetical protein ACTSU7_13130 [Candidatus Heimdallarchaeaceae archaeon]
MNQIFNKQEGRFEANTLFIQLAKSCSRNCRNCYVKAHVGNESSIISIGVLLDIMTNRKKYSFNQITLSVNDATDDELEPLVAVVKKIENRLNEHDRYVDKTLLTAKSLHISLRNAEVFKKLYLSDSNRILGITDSFSFSEPSSVKDIKKFCLYSPVWGFNLNYMIPQSLDYRRIMNEIDTLKKYEKDYKQIYCIIEKLPMEHKDSETIKQEQERLKKEMYFINTLFESEHQNLVSKCLVDGCLMINKKNADNPHNIKGCGAGVSSFHLWPDGSVSGCPYAKNSNTPPAKTADKVFSNLKQERDGDNYDFSTKCYLPSVFL